MARKQSSRAAPAAPAVSEESSAPLDPYFLELIPDAVVVVAASGRVVQANSYASQLFDVPHASLVGRLVEDLVPSEVHKCHGVQRRRYQAHPRRREIGSGLELWAQRPSGERFPVEVSLMPITETDGTVVVVVVAAIRDVSERRAALGALRASENRFRRVFEDAPIGMALIQLPDAAVVEMNARFAEIAGRAASELIGAAVDVLIHEDDRALVGDEIAALGEQVTTTVRFECRLATSTEDERWVTVAASALAGDDNPLRVIAQVEDISARRAAEQRLEQPARL